MILLTPDDGPEERDPEAWVALEHYPDPISAELARVRVEEAGFPARVFDAGAGALGAYATGLSAVRLMVRAGDLEAARAALDQEADAAENPVNEADDITRTESYCPRCHARDFDETRNEARPWWRRLLAPGLERTCRACGHVWRAP